MARKSKYDPEWFTPPKSVQREAEQGLKLRRELNRGGLSNKEASEQGIGSGVQRAVNLKNGNELNPQTIKRMRSFFARHEKNKDSVDSKGRPGAGKIAWLLWGGDSGRRWADSVYAKMQKADDEV